MKIHFTKQEYRALVEMLLIADWVLHAHEVEPADATEPYDGLRKKVLSHHKAMGMEEEFEYAPKDDDYYETADYEAHAPHTRFIDTYDDQVFWSQLAERLAARDLAAEAAPDPLGPADEEARLTRLFELTEHYEALFAKSGVDSIRCIPTTSPTH
jgi:hypothetical protein